jgi:choline dehydrogenase-like flavoprotein
MKQFGKKIGNSPATAFSTRIRANLQGQFDLMVCGAGTSGSVVAGRLAANPEVKVLLLEAGETGPLPTKGPSHKQGVAHICAGRREERPQAEGC